MYTNPTVSQKPSLNTDPVLSDDPKKSPTPTGRNQINNQVRTQFAPVRKATPNPAHNSAEALKGSPNPLQNNAGIKPTIQPNTPNTPQNNAGIKPAIQPSTPNIPQNNVGIKPTIQPNTPNTPQNNAGIKPAIQPSTPNIPQNSVGIKPAIQPNTLNHLQNDTEVDPTPQPGTPNPAQNNTGVKTTIPPGMPNTSQNNAEEAKQDKLSKLKQEKKDKLEAKEKGLQDKLALLSAAELAVENRENVYNQNYPQYQESLKEESKQTKELEQKMELLQQKEVSLQKAEDTLFASKAELQNKENQLKAREQELEKKKDALTKSNTKRKDDLNRRELQLKKKEEDLTKFEPNQFEYSKKMKELNKREEELKEIDTKLKKRELDLKQKIKQEKEYLRLEEGKLITKEKLLHTEFCNLSITFYKKSNYSINFATNSERGACTMCSNCIKLIHGKNGCEFCDHTYQEHDLVNIPTLVDFKEVCSSPYCININTNGSYAHCSKRCRDEAAYPPKNCINFYDKNERYYEFTNFYQSPVEIDGKVWSTTEHYFQGMKFHHITIHTAIKSMTYQEVQQAWNWQIIEPQEKETPSFSFPSANHANLAMRFSAASRLSEVIRASSDPRFAFEFPRTWSRFVRSDWHDIKINYMFYALQHKFKTNRALKNLLKGTNNQIIVEHTKNDDFWADGGNGTGKNWLGKLLMITRLTLDQ